MTETPAGTWLSPGASRMTPAQKNACGAAALLLLAAGIFTLHEFLPALAWTAVFAIALWPLFQRLARRWPRHRHGLLPALFILGVILIFVIPVILIAIPLAADSHAAFQFLAQIRQNGLPPPGFLNDLPAGAKLTGLWQQYLSAPGQISAITSKTIHNGGGGGAKVAALIGRETIHRLVLFFFMLLGLFFLLRSADDVVEQLKIASRRAFGPAGEDIGGQVINSIHGTVNGLVLVGLGEGVLLGIAYFIAGVPHPTLFGLVTAILAMVPFGAAIAVFAAGAVLLAQGSTIAAIIIVALGLVVIFIADHFIRPVLIGGATRLPFYWVLLGILGGVTAWHLVGLFIGPAIMAALILLWREWIGAELGPINPVKSDVDPQP